jgi:urease accessory protein
MLLIEQRAPADASASERLSLSFELRCKSRLRTKLDSGEEAGLFLERGAILRAGDKLLGKDGRIVEVAAAPEKVIEARSDDLLLLARAAYHLGNRHVPVQVATGLLRFGQDHVLGEMVRGLGLAITETEAPFEPESGAYAGKSGNHGGHTHPQGHSADGEGALVNPRPRIHDMLIVGRR